MIHKLHTETRGLAWWLVAASVIGLAIGRPVAPTGLAFVSGGWFIGAALAVAIRRVRGGR